MTGDQLTVDVERHERTIYGGNGEGIGMLARVKNVEDFVIEFRADRKASADDRRKIFNTVISGVIIQVLILVAVLIWTHPAVQGAAAYGATPIP